MTKFRKLLNYIYPNFNPVDTKFIEGNDVAYGLGYQDNGDGTSEVELISSPSYPLGKSIIHNTDRSIPNALKDQLSLSLIADSAETDEIGIIFPTDKGLSLNTYEVKHSVNASSVKRLSIVKLQKNKEGNNPANSDNRYSDPQAVTLDNGDVVVIAKNLKDKTLVSWYLKSENGKFEAVAGNDGITERKLLKLSDTGNQFVLNGKTLLYSQRNKRIIENQEVETTDVFIFNMAKTFQNLKNGKGIKEYLLGNKNGQINREPFFSSKNEISFLQYVKRGRGDIVAFLEKDKSSNKQKLSLIALQDGKLLAYDGSEFKDSIEQLYVKKSGQGDAIVTAISGENIITFIKKSFGRSAKATIPASNITSLSDFVAIIHGRLTRDISTLPPITATETVVTPEPTSTASVPDSSSQSSSIAPKADEGDASSTEKPTTSGKSTQKVFTIPSVSEILTANSTTPTFTTPLLPQTSSSPQPHKLSFAGADRSTNIGVMLASLLGVLGLAGTGFVVYKLVQRCLRNHDEPGYNHYQSSRPNRMSLQNLVRVSVQRYGRGKKIIDRIYQSSNNTKC